MFVILAYAPFLLALPLLLIAGLVFVVVPGGFIVVLVALYYLAQVGLFYAFTGLAGLVELAANRRSHVRARRGRRPSTSSEEASPSRRPSLGRRGPAIPVGIAFTGDRAVVPSPNLTLNGHRTGDLDRIRALDARRVADRQDQPRPVSLG